MVKGSLSLKQQLQIQTGRQKPKFKNIFQSVNKEEIRFNMEQELINNKIIKINRKIFYKEKNELTY